VGKTKREEVFWKMECPLLVDLSLEEQKIPKKSQFLVLERENVDIKITGQKSGKKAIFGSSKVTKNI
jgi:hypothetical protein